MTMSPMGFWRKCSPFCNSCKIEHDFNQSSAGDWFFHDNSYWIDSNYYHLVSKKHTAQT